MNRRIKAYETHYGTGAFMKETDDICLEADKPFPSGDEWGLVNIYDEVEYQSILGFGGAFTEATASNLARVSPEMRQKVLELYFDREKGIGYNFCRSTINSCDFSEDFYSYDDTDGDFELKHFDISHDKKAVIPAMISASEIAPDLRIFASPWSPPAWMKTNGRMNRGGELKKECYDVWGRYYARFIEEYKKAGVDIWGITVQNESKAVQGWESCVYTGEQERDLVVNHIKPAFIKAGLGDKKIFYWDHNKERTVERSLETLSDDKAREAFDGVAVHWYSGEHFSALDITHQLFPEKYIIASEQSQGRGREAYTSGEKYAHDIIGDLNNWANAWTDWNMLLDENGSPDHWKDEQVASGLKPEEIWVGESPIVYDSATDSLDIRSSYYYLGHFSKFIRRDAKRIGCSTFDSQIECTAFRNPDGSVILVSLNRTESDRSFKIRYRGELAAVTLKAHSIMTFIF